VLDIEEESSSKDTEDDQIAEEPWKHHGHNLLLITEDSGNHLRNLAHASFISETKEARKLRF